MAENRCSRTRGKGEHVILDHPHLAGLWAAQPALHARGEKREPVNGIPPFLEQEFDDVYENGVN